MGALVIAAGRWAMQPRGEQGAVGTSGAVESAAPAPVATAATAASSTKTQSSPSVVRVNLEAQRPVWVTAVVDGDRAVYRTLEPGERVALNGTREISIRAGDAGAEPRHHRNDVGAAQLLIENGCQNQLDLLVESASNAGK